MAPLKRLGDLAELTVAADLVRRGHRVLLPFGEDHDYDLVVERPDGRLERVQVKYTRSDGAVVQVRAPQPGAQRPAMRGPAGGGPPRVLTPTLGLSSGAWC